MERVDAVQTIRKVHSVLRNSVKNDGNVDRVWQGHKVDSESLQRYSEAMVSIANIWQNSQPPSEDRVEWCMSICREYFWKGGLKHTLLKGFKKIYHSKQRNGISPTESLQDFLKKNDPSEKIDNCFCNQRLSVLDVGSCYNPFKMFDNEIQVLPIDLFPATDDVYSGDFLEIEVIKDAENSRRLFFDDKTLPERCKEKGKIEDVHGNDSSLKICHQEYLTNPLKKLPSDSFHVVILSLVLSYLPTPRQRMDCCIKANRLLSENGLLLLIESDSAHQNRNCQQMVAWKMALESIGFARYRYQKLVHLQCMAFRKTACVDQLINQVELTHNYDVMFIPQDFHEEKCDFEQKNVTERTSDQNKEVCDIFSTLPHCI